MSFHKTDDIFSFTPKLEQTKQTPDSPKIFRGRKFSPEGMTKKARAKPYPGSSSPRKKRLQAKKQLPADREEQLGTQTLHIETQHTEQHAIKQLFEGPKSSYISPHLFTLNLDKLLTTAPLLKQETITQITEKGILHAQQLLTNHCPLEAEKLLQHLLQLTPTNVHLQFQLLQTLAASCKRSQTIEYAKALICALPVEDATQVTNFIVSYSLSCGAFDDATASTNLLKQKVPPQEQAALDDNIQFIQDEKTSFLSVNDPKKSQPSPIIQLSEPQFNGITHLFKNDNIDGLEDFFSMFYTFCIGNEEFSKTLRTIGKAKQKELPAFAGICTELSILSYKTTPANLSKYFKATEKLSLLLSKLEKRRDFIGHERVVKRLENPTTPLEQYYSQKELENAMAKYKALKENISYEDFTIHESEQLTGSDLLAIYSFINLTTSLLPLFNCGVLRNHQQVLPIIQQGLNAEKLSKQLLSLLGDTYQTGDLSFRNLNKFDSLTGKDQGWMMNLYKKIFSLGHAALIDQSMDLQDITYSHVLDRYVYANVNIEEFFCQDLYRVQVGSLLSQEGKDLLTKRLHARMENADISPLTTVDQFVQDTFTERLENILAGPEIEEPLSADSMTEADIKSVQLMETNKHREASFSSIHNDGMLQIKAGINPLPHHQLTSYLPWTASQPIDFKEVQLEGNMICSQFQALATFKALAHTQEILVSIMAEQLSIDEGTSEEIALQKIQSHNPFKIPVSVYERPDLLTPKRVADLLKEFLKPVPMNPIAKELLNLPEQIYETALFGKKQD